jgi:hypothetical protein
LSVCRSGLFFGFLPEFWNGLLKKMIHNEQ